jgi:2',3'-cyclic-nucleotide 2'-phosphodiesterase
MRILVIGDIIGSPGRLAAKEAIRQIKNEEKIDFVIANGENMAHGVGMTPRTYEMMREAGVDFFTTGNHILKRPEIFPEMEKEDSRIIRPANFPPGNPGKGFQVVSVGKKKILIVNVVGRVYMSHNYDCPFRKMDEVLGTFEKQKLDGILVDFHAEATSEKIALKHYLDGRVAALWGTHTHVPTADAEVTEKGMATITDLGMVGPTDSVIGDEKGSIIESFLRQTNFKLEVASGRCVFNAVVIELTGRQSSKSIRFIQKFIDG